MRCNKLLLSCYTMRGKTLCVLVKKIVRSQRRLSVLKLELDLKFKL